MRQLNKNLQFHPLQPPCQTLKLSRAASTPTTASTSFPLLPRRQIAVHHSATHLLHSVLSSLSFPTQQHEISLQTGSHIAPTSFSFDFYAGFLGDQLKNPSAFVADLERRVNAIAQSGAASPFPSSRYSHLLALLPTPVASSALHRRRRRPLAQERSYPRRLRPRHQFGVLLRWFLRRSLTHRTARRQHRCRLPLHRHRRPVRRRGHQAHRSQGRSHRRPGTTGAAPAPAGGDEGGWLRREGAREDRRGDEEGGGGADERECHADARCRGNLFADVLD